MGVSSYFEFVTVLFGWIVYDRLWAVLNDTGIVYVPFFVILLKNLLESRRGGDDEGSAAIQSLKKSETDIVVAIVVMFLAAVPFTEVRLGEMSYVRPQLDCAVEQRIARGAEPAEVNGLATGTAYDAPLGTLSGEVGRIPIWWGFVHVVSKAVVAAGTAAIPCTGDVVRLTMTLGNDTVEDPLLLRELADFTTDCHRPAIGRMYNGGPGGATFAARSRMDYLGSTFFLDTHGYYDLLYSRRARPAFPPNPARDAGLDGSHPTCREWWRDGGERAARAAARGDRRADARRDGLRPERDSPRGEPGDVGRGAGGPAAAPLPGAPLRGPHRRLVGELRAGGGGELPDGGAGPPRGARRRDPRHRGRDRRRAVDGRGRPRDGAAGGRATWPPGWRSARACRSS